VRAPPCHLSWRPRRLRPHGRRRGGALAGRRSAAWLTGRALGRDGRPPTGVARDGRNAGPPLSDPAPAPLLRARALVAGRARGCASRTRSRCDAGVPRGDLHALDARRGGGDEPVRLRGSVHQRSRRASDGVPENVTARTCRRTAEPDRSAGEDRRVRGRLLEPHSFTRAFVARYGAAPAHFRSRAERPAPNVAPMRREDCTLRTVDGAVASTSTAVPSWAAAS
jgi:hypothetical protein